MAPSTKSLCKTEAVLVGATGEMNVLVDDDDSQSTPR